LYVLLFPQLVAGPIVRYHEVADQLAERRVRWDDFSYGVSRFVLGLGKKVLLANTLAEVADAVFRLPPGDLDLKVSWLGASAYALQIYFDFSGYSDMAIGLARMFGFRFPENFAYPYVAQSMTEFWRRWHMSLSRFFRDYLYIPLGGNRVGPTRLHFNLFTVFLLCGLWHGASWNFVLWGALHGAFLVLERGGAGRLLQLAPSPVRHVYCLLVVLLTWVFFRAATLPEAIGFLRAMIGRGHGGGVVRASDFLDHQRTLAFAVALVAMTPVLPRLQSWLRNAPLPLHATASLARVGIPVVVFVVCVMRLSSGTYNPFIYFRF
jgi:alginate O-acetyltransferase complex protein AlgI